MANVPPNKPRNETPQGLERRADAFLAYHDPVKRPGYALTPKMQRTRAKVRKRRNRQKH